MSDAERSRGLLRSQSFVRLAQTGGLSADEVELLYRRAERYARREQEDDRGAGHDYVRFTRGGTCYAVPVSSLLRIVRVAHLSRIPGGAAHVPGVFSYRGEILSGHDLSVFLGASDAAVAPAWALIVEGPANRLGLLADEVLDLVDIGPVEVQPVPLTLGVRGRGFRGILRDGTLLALPKLLEDPDFRYAFPPAATP